MNFPISPRNDSVLANGHEASTPRSVTPPLWVSLAAAIVLLILTGLSLNGNARPTPADQATLLFLALAGLIAFSTPLQRYFQDDTRPDAANASAYALTAAMFVVYGIARRDGLTSDTGWSLNFAFMPDEPVVVPYATRLVIFTGLLALPFLFKGLGGWAKSLLVGTVVVAVFGIFSFRFLSGYYPVGATEVLDPTPLVQGLMQFLEYATLAILCRAATAQPVVRLWLLRVLPALLLGIWTRHHFMAAPIVEDDQG